VPVRKQNNPIIGTGRLVGYITKFDVPRDGIGVSLKGDTMAPTTRHGHNQCVVCRHYLLWPILN